MEHCNVTATADLTKALYAALTLAERAACLRQFGTQLVVSESRAERAASVVEQWRSQKPFGAADFFERRLRLDGLTEEDLLTIAGLPTEVYSELMPDPPDWILDLERLYWADVPEHSTNDGFVEWAEQGTNGLLWVAHPLIQEGFRLLREGMGRLPAGSTPFELSTVERLVSENLLRTLKATVERTLALELNVARLQGLLEGQQPEDRLRSFCGRLRQRDVRQSIAREYPVLLRSLYAATRSWAEYSVELLTRLANDWDLIREELVPGLDESNLISISAGAGDAHRRGKTVAILEFASGGKLVYKPRSQSVDVHFGELLEWMNQAGFQAPFRILKVVDRGPYGWSEFVGHKACRNSSEVARFYQRLGGYLAVCYLLKANDMHARNLTAAGEFPAITDLETLFQGIDGEEDPSISAWQRSVLRVLLLPDRILASGTHKGVDISGLGATSGQILPKGKASSWEGEGTDEMRLVRSNFAMLDFQGNRPTLEGKHVAVGDYLAAFETGFEQAYRLIEAGRDELQAPGGILDRFGEDEVRFLARPTPVYVALLRAGRHPDLLRDAIDRDRLLDRLWLGAAALPQLTRLIPAELMDLRKGDIPVFTSRPGSRDLWASAGERIPDVFEQTPMAVVREGLNNFGPQDLALQKRFIRTAILSAEMPDAAGPVVRSKQSVHLSEDMRNTAIGLASAIGDKLCEEAFEDDVNAGWIGLQPMGPSEHVWSLQPLDTDFYSGLSGCFFFLAYLSAVTGDESYGRISRKALRVVRGRLERRRAAGVPIQTIGGFAGAGGIIYALAHLGVLWEDESLTDEARIVASEVDAIVDADQSLDVISGAAGCIAALQVLNKINASDRLLGTAVRCGERLLGAEQLYKAGTGPKSGRPLTGFSRGAAGIGWALLKLAAWSGLARFRTAAEKAIACERSCFVAEEQNWPDFREPQEENQSNLRFSVGWCHGAPGIGLSRIDSLQHLDDRESREEIRIALRKTVASGFGRNHCLCHGDLGNLDILLQAGQRVDESWWSEIGRGLAAETLTTITESGWACGLGNSLEAPGLMTGLAGIGYGLLRVACPQKVPSVLILAPPSAF